jgi:sarcosine oxidase
VSRFDAAVVGLGEMGSAACYHLARRGLRVLGLERFGPAHDRGSSHGSSRIIRQAYFEHPDYVPLLLRAYELWRELQAESGMRLLLRTGGLMIGPEEGAVVSGALKSARRHALAHKLLTPAELRRMIPAFEPVREVALYEPEAGVLFPEDCVVAHLDGARRRGAVLRFGALVESLDSIPAERVVITAGAWASRFLPNLPLSVERVLLYWFEPGDVAPFAPDRFPIWIWDVPGLAFYGFPSLDGETVKVAFHHGGEPADPDALRREVARAEVDRMRERLRRTIPALDAPLRRAVACMYTNTPDEHFAIGLERPGAAFAAGFSGHGFKFASVVGEILADLVVDGKTRHEIGFLSPRRFA